MDKARGFAGMAGALLARAKAGARGALPRTSLGQQLALLVPSVLVLSTAFLSPHVLQLIRGPTPVAQNSTLSAAFSAALSLRFPTTVATDDTLTSGADALEALLQRPPDGSAGVAVDKAATAPEAVVVGSGAEVERDTVVKAPLVDVDMQGLSAAAAAERRAREEQLISQHTQCSCYKVKNSFCCAQSLCLCGPLCWNGRELVAQVRHGSAQVECREPMEAAKAGDIVVDSDVLTHLKCQELLEAEPGLRVKPLDMCLQEGGFKELGKRDQGWLEERKHTATWRLGGATFLRHLDIRAATDASAFASRLFPLLLLNNATVEGGLLRPQVQHVMLPRDKFFRAVAEEHGSEGLLAHLLELLLRSALQPLGLGSGGFVVPEWHRQRVVGEEVDPSQEALLGGTTGGSGAGIRKHVEFERAWDAATEASPLCLEQVILPGNLKGLVFPNNTQQAEAFRAQALHFLSLPLTTPPSEPGQVHLLFLRRADISDRVFEVESERRLMKLFRDANFARIEVLDLRSPSASTPAMALAQVVQAVRSADVIVGLHGSALVHAGTFLRPGTVVLEIVPHHLFFSDVQVLVAASGGLFLQHMLLPSKPPPPGPSASMGLVKSSTALDRGVNPQWDNIDFKYWDDEYSKHTVAHCMNSRLNFKCRQYFMRDRPILLSPEDEGEVSALLGLAKHFVETTQSKGLKEARAELARQSVSVCKSGFQDLGFVATDWLFDPTLPAQLCILKRTYWREG